MEDREKKFINDIGQHFDASEDLLKSNKKAYEKKLKDKKYDEQ